MQKAKQTALNLPAHAQGPGEVNGAVKRPWPGQ